MKNIGIVSVLLFVFMSCQQKKQDKQPVLNKQIGLKDSLNPMPALQSTLQHPDNEDEHTLNEETATYFIVVADTGKAYHPLLSTMLNLEQQLHMIIDTMGRSYNAAKNLIALSENDPDEIYAGDYFPRRTPSATLSLEYLHFYLPTAGEKTIALVAGIYEKQSSADSAVTLLKTKAAKTFAFPAYVYIGCTH
jgi:hypothetical protein